MTPYTKTKLSTSDNKGDSMPAKPRSTSRCKLLHVAALLLCVPFPAKAESFTFRVRTDDGTARVVSTGLQLYSILRIERNQVKIKQRGSDNTASVAQAGSGNAAHIYQRGKGHAATVEQSGSGNAIGVFQFGRNQSYSATQNGRGRNEFIFQGGW